MFYVAIGYALTFAAAEMPAMLGNTPADSPQVEMVAEVEPSPQAEPVSVDDLQANFEEVDHELERAARDFRIETYHTHRLDRDTFNHHTQAGQQLYQAWRQNPGSDDQRAELLAWFDQAETHSRLAQQLPATPGFLQEDTSMLAAEEFEAPQVVVELNEPSEDSLLESPPLPPTASATPLPPHEMQQPEVTPALQPTEEPKAQVDPLAALDELSWGASQESLDFESNHALRQEMAQYNHDLLTLLTYLSGDEPWTVEKLEPLSMQLTDLAAQRQILTVRAQLQNAKANELLSLDPALELFAERVREARGHVERLGLSFPRGVEMERLEALEDIHTRLEAGN